MNQQILELIEELAAWRDGVTAEAAKRELSIAITALEDAHSRIQRAENLQLVGTPVVDHTL